MNPEEMRNMVIAGGNSGIGARLLELALKGGYNITVLSRRTDGLPESERVHHVNWDVREPLPDRSVLPDHIHGLVYLPGTINLKTFNLLNDNDFRNDYEINVLGAVRLVRGSIAMLKAAQGSVVFFGSVAASVGFPFHASISSAKGALESLTRSLAAEYAGAGVRFNMLALSLTDTPLASGLLKTERQRLAAVERHPIKGIGNPDSAARWTLNLISAESSWITGQVIGIDGGISTVRTG
jgi:NAD(P)-dependent dehydrogenase (short-subunit alcohol dehydrogenase family)